MYTWKVVALGGELEYWSTLELNLNSLERDGFEVFDVRWPQGERDGDIVILARRPASAEPANVDGKIVP